MENKIQYRLIKKFGPSIFHVRIPEEIITKLNNYVDKVVQDKQKSKELDVGKNLVGDVTQELVLEHDFKLIEDKETLSKRLLSGI